MNMTVKHSFYVFSHVKKHIRVEGECVMCFFLNVSERTQACRIASYQLPCS